MKNTIIKRIIASALTLSLAASFAACSTSNASDSTVIKVGANITPHSEILEIAKPILADKGITLEIVKLEDSVTPNTGVLSVQFTMNHSVSMQAE